jgi:hypothetical protein
MPTILLAIDAFSPLDRLLPAAVLLASRQHAELLAVFSQDNRLIRGAALSCTQEIGANSAICYPVTSTSIEKRVQRIADDMRRRLSKAAERQQIPWEFQQCFSSISQITTETDAEIVLPGWSESPWVGPESFHLTPRRTSMNPIILVIDDGLPCSAHVIEVARGLAGANGQPQLIILGLHAAFESGSDRREMSADDRTGEIRIPVASSGQLIRQLQLSCPTLTLVGREQLASADNQIHKALKSIKCPLALLRRTR